MNMNLTFSNGITMALNMTTPGAKGESIESVSLNHETGMLTVILTNGTSVDVGNVETIVAAVEARDAAIAAKEAAEAQAILAANNILNGVTTHNNDASAHPAITADIRSVEAIARGRATAHVFDTWQDMEDWLAIPANVETLVVGDNLYITDVGVKDQWWDGTTHHDLESEAPDLTDYYTKTQTDALLPIIITQTAYDALVAAGTLEARRIYYIVGA